ncbi:MAG: phosphoserine phosphatase SerB [Proteobacteria bacterium]|nr:phosphoserine phosphatase SerB [Pseudomonadota bacterium]
MAENRMAILLTINGKDSPGITAALTSTLAEAGAVILDIEQVVIHNILTLSILIEAHKEEKKSLLKDLLYQSKELSVDLDFSLVPEKDVITSRPSTHTCVITCLGEFISTKAISTVTSALYDKEMNIEKIGKLAWGKLSCLEILASASSPISVKDLAGYFLEISHNTGVDIAVQRESLFRKAKRLVVMDMDSTLIQAEVIDELAALVGAGERVKNITERAMSGEIDFSESLRKRVSLLNGLSVDALAEVYDNLPLTQGAESLIKVLKRLGYKTAVISGGFNYFTHKLQERLGLDYAFANQLEIVDGKLTGRISGDIVDAAMKAKLLEDIAAREQISLDQVIAIGDGANDLPMLGKAGLGIAFNAKKSVREAASYSISQKSLDSILYLLGINENELKELG